MESEMIRAANGAWGDMPAPLPLAMAYIPPQRWTAVYDRDQALAAGTLFPALDLPFEEAAR